MMDSGWEPRKGIFPHRVDCLLVVGSGPIIAKLYTLFIASRELDVVWGCIVSCMLRVSWTEWFGIERYVREYL